MTQHRGTTVPGGGSISIGGNVTGSAVVAGRGNRVTVSTHHVPEGVAAALGEVRAALDALSGPRAAGARREADAALAAANQSAPDNDAIGGALEGALEAARTTAEFAEVAVKLGPPLQSLIGWLGGGWSHLTTLLS